MSYAIPKDELSISKMEAFRTNAKMAALKKANDLKLAATLKELTFREAAPGTDLSQPAGAGYTNEVYLTGAVAANVWTSVYDTAVVPTLGRRQVAVFYKVWNRTVPAQITAVRFRLGPTGATTLGWFHIEMLDVQQTAELYFSEPVVFGPDERLFIECISPVAIAAVGEHLGFGCFIAEPVGESIS
jgi:hypothetical protein